MEILKAAGTGREGTYMALIRLELHEHPAPPHHEIREKTVLDSADRIVGTVANLYVDEDSRQLRFVDVLTMSGLLGLERRHHLLPVEAVREEGLGSITLGVDQQSVQSAPVFPNPHVVPDEEYQRTIRDHYGLIQQKPDLLRNSLKNLPEKQFERPEQQWVFNNRKLRDGTTSSCSLVLMAQRFGLYPDFSDGLMAEF